MQAAALPRKTQILPPVAQSPPPSPSDSNPSEHTHSYTEVITALTCTEKGYTTYTCTCGHSYTGNETAAAGHNYENGVCSACGASDCQTPTDDALNGEYIAYTQKEGEALTQTIISMDSDIHHYAVIIRLFIPGNNEDAYEIQFQGKPYYEYTMGWEKGGSWHIEENSIILEIYDMNGADICGTVKLALLQNGHLSVAEISGDFSPAFPFGLTVGHKFSADPNEEIIN